MNQETNQNQQSSGSHRDQGGAKWASGQTPNPSFQPEQEGSASRQQNAGKVGDQGQQGQQGQQNRGPSQGSQQGGSQSGSH